MISVIEPKFKAYFRKHPSSIKLNSLEFEQFYEFNKLEMSEKLTLDIQYMLELIKSIINPKTDEFTKKSWDNIVRTISAGSKNPEFKAKIDYNIKGKKELQEIYRLFEQPQKLKIMEGNVKTHYYIILLIINLQTKSYPRVTINNLNDIKVLIEFFDSERSNKRNQYYWFRGQSNYNWDLIPSFLRNIDREQVHFISQCRYIDDTEIYGNEFDPNSFYGKYSKIFLGKKFDYEFVSYMQHSISYSPLLDFTNNFLVAISFAIQNKSSINDFFYQDSSIFLILPKQEDIIVLEQDYNDIIKRYKVGVFSNNMKSNDLNYLYNRMGNKLYTKAAKVSFCNYETNDRMKYQNGKFLLYDDFFIYSKDSIPIDINNSIIKIKINRNIKLELYNYINSRYPEYEIDNLMNPYRFFSK